MDCVRGFRRPYALGDSPRAFPIVGSKALVTEEKRDLERARAKTARKAGAELLGSGCAMLFDRLSRSALRLSADRAWKEART